MAQYKIPQDVEAEDKLIGPFSFRQFIYLGVAALGAAVCFGLWRIFPGLIIIPLPFIVLFLVLALPLRKDQPMETYLTAVIRFYLKPRRRLWQPEGSIGLVTVVAPQMTQVQLTKSIGGTAAAEQLGYLAQVVDTQGWATRGVVSPTASMNDIAYSEAQQAEVDVIDENTNIAQTFDSMLDRTSDQHKQQVAEQFRQAMQQPAPAAPVAAPQLAMPTIGGRAQLNETPLSDQQAPQQQHLNYNPYPSSMHQHIVQPIDDFTITPVASSAPQPVQQAQATNISNSTPAPSREEVSPDIIRLANNDDLSLSALANEAHRIESRDSEEVVINLH